MIKQFRNTLIVTIFGFLLFPLVSMAADVEELTNTVGKVIGRV